MGKIGIILVLIAWAFSFLIITPTLNVMPVWITDNAQLYQFTIIILTVGFALAFIKFGMRK